MEKKLLVLLIMLIIFPQDLAAVPAFLSHQGRIIDSENTPVSGVDNMTFTLFDSEETGNTIWTETVTVTLDNGYYHVVLGSDTPLQSSDFDGSPIFLEIMMDGQGPFSPRATITSVPYSFRAVYAEKSVEPVEEEHIANKGYVDSQVTGHEHDDYYSKTYVDDTFYSREHLDNDYFTGIYITDNYFDKEDIESGYYTQSYIDSGFYSQVHINDNYYTASHIDDAFYAKEHIDNNYYTQSEVDSIISSSGAVNITMATQSGMSVGDELVVDHGSDPEFKRSVTGLAFLGSYFDSAFYVNGENGGVDYVNNVAPSFLDGTSYVADSGKFGSHSMFSNDYHTYASWNLPSGTLNFGAGDFTIRMWFKTNQGYLSGGFWGTIMGTAPDHNAPSGDNWAIGLFSLENLQFSSNGANVGQGNNGAKYSANTWYHIAIERHNGTIFFYVNGRILTNVSHGASVGADQNSTLYLGCLRDWDNVPQLQYDEIEIIKSAIYGGQAFTAPSAPDPIAGGGELWTVVNPDNFKIDYLDEDTTRITRLNEVTSDVKVIVRTY